MSPFPLFYAALVLYLLLHDFLDFEVALASPASRRDAWGALEVDLSDYAPDVVRRLRLLQQRRREFSIQCQQTKSFLLVRLLPVGSRLHFIGLELLAASAVRYAVADAVSLVRESLLDPTQDLGLVDLKRQNRIAFILYEEGGRVLMCSLALD